MKRNGKIVFHGEIDGDRDISAIASFGDFLAIGSDESTQKIQIFKKQDEDNYQVENSLEITLPVSDFKEDEEIDIEGMSVNYNDDNQTVTLFVVGSHSLKRSKVKDKRTYIKNRERLVNVIPEEKKNSIFVINLDLNTGKKVDKQNNKLIRIKELIDSDPILQRFTNIPSKENGVDIEGISSEGKTLYLGFRGPVLRGNYVPLMVIEDWTDKDKSEYELRFVQLEGNGIRDITKVKDGFLIVAGPVGDGNSSYQLYFWNGIDSIPGKDKEQTVGKTILQKLGEIPTSPDAKAEGITVGEETDSTYTFIIVYDSVAHGGAERFTIAKQNS